VHPALDGGDAVGEAVEAVGVVAGVPLEGDLDLHRRVVGVLGLAVVADLAEKGLLGSVHVTHEVTDAAVVAEADRRCPAGAVVAERDLEAGVQERHHLEALRQRRGAEVGLVEDRRIGPEPDGGPGPRLPVRPDRCISDDVELLGELTAVGEGHQVAFALAVDLDLDA